VQELIVVVPSHLIVAVERSKAQLEMLVPWIGGTPGRVEAVVSVSVC
jgi:hypothetical protein